MAAWGQDTETTKDTNHTKHHAKDGIGRSTVLHNKASKWRPRKFIQVLALIQPQMQPDRNIQIRRARFGSGFNPNSKVRTTEYTEHTEGNKIYRAPRLIWGDPDPVLAKSFSGSVCSVFSVVLTAASGFNLSHCSRGRNCSALRKAMSAHQWSRFCRSRKVRW